MASFHKVWLVWGSCWVLRSTVLEYVTSPGMDADTQGLASALALLGIYNVADLVELAHTGSLVEMILTAVEQQDLEQRATEAVSGLRAAAEQRATHAAQAEARAVAAATAGMVDVATAEAMVVEALRMADEAKECERAAEECARTWEGRAELGATLLRTAEDRTDRAQAGWQAAERSAAAERAAKQVAEELLASEAALADATVEI